MTKQRTYTLTCKKCGKEFSHTTPNKVYCSDECKKNSKESSVCPICGNTFVKYNKRSKYCCDKCHIIARDRMARERLVKTSKSEFTGIEGVDYVECKICGQRMKFFQQSHLNMHKISKEEYEAKYGKIKAYSDKHIENHLKGENNGCHKSKTTEKDRKERSPFSKSFWIKRGLSEEEYKKFIDNVCKNREYNTRLSFYTNRGYSLEEAKIKLKERQSIGMGGSYSKVCEDFIGNVIGSKRSKYLFGKREKRISYKDESGKLRYFRYDLTSESTKKIIEFNGDFWHGNPKIVNLEDTHPVINETFVNIHKKDNFKKSLAEQHGYDVLVIWESDYILDKKNTIKRAKEFINEKRSYHE